MQLIRNIARVVATATVFASACSPPPPVADAGDAQAGVDAVGDAVVDVPRVDGERDVSAPMDVAPDTAAPDTATSDAGRRRGTGTIMGTVGGAPATPVDVVFQPSPACGGASGIYLATSGVPVACVNPLAGELRQPYIQMRIASRTPGTYTLVADGTCTSTTTARVFTATFQAEGLSTFDGATGTLEITASSAEEITGRLNVTFGTPAAGTLMGTFTATACPP